MDYPELFNITVGPQSRCAEDWAQTILDHHPGRRFNTIMDVGCGPGLITVTFLQKFCPKNGIIAIDIGEKMIEFAKKNNGHPNIEYHVADAGGDWTDFLQHSNLWSQGGVDLVISNFCIQRVADKDKLARNIFNVLVPGGLMYHKVPYYTPFFQRAEAIRDHPAWHQFLTAAPAPPPHHVSDVWKSEESQLAWCQQWTRLFERAELVDVSTKISQCIQPFDNREQLFAFQKSLSLHYKRYIPDHLHDKFYEQYRQLAFPETYFAERGGVVEFEFWLGILVGYKATE